MKILIVTTIFPPDIGGPATYSYEIAKRLTKLGHKVVIVTYGNKQNKKINGFCVYYIKYPEISKIFNYPYRLINAFLVTKKITKKFNPDIIYAQNPDMAGIPSYLVSKLYRKKFVLKFVGDWVWEFAKNKNLTDLTLEEFYNNTNDKPIIKIMKKVEKKIINSTNQIITPSHYLKLLLKSWSIKPKIDVVYNAVKLDKFDKINLEGKNIIAVGRLVPWKKFDDIIKTISKINANLIIVGSGPKLEDWKNLVNKLNLNKKVKFLGSLDRKETLAYIEASDILILPSLYEGQSHVLLEAMALKTPIIASNISSNTELIKERGILIQPGDLEQLEKEIKDTLDGKNYTSEAYNFIKKNNTWDILVKKTLEVLK
ncbi:hypothetical protein CL621_04245 [archaeon]|nr:hypothetical protein [archaeon]